ncbi:MAG TPA: GntR family transcriptional regulator [Treponema sp.]|nr:GntR family transcriptional regulator [Treponema sp.]HPC70409.1 GntR family transcriptional regulator [Treponema sp.]HRS03412.1 GntR family transcriptional regulator [Treponema sp.]HRU28239.1 GntR family transcriptional regulator [Treponema sp.]
MELPRLQAPSLKELFIKEMEAQILSGKLPIGSKLPSEREIAEAMGVSRAVVNAGLMEMARKGFLEIKPRSGAFVADYRRKGTSETLLSIMNFNGGMLGKQEIKSILELRLVLETLALELAIPRMTDEDIKVIKGHLDRYAAAEDPQAAAEAAFCFHYEIGVLSGNTLLPLIFYSFRTPVIMLWKRYIQLHGKDKLYENIRSIYEQVSQRNVTEAVRVFQEAVNQTISGGVSIYYE